MKKLTFIWLLVSATFFCVAADLVDQSALFESANTAYKDANYFQAIEQYSALLEQGENAQLFYNLGNSYYKAGDFTQAILNYEKALKYSPNDRDIQHNLDIANLNIIDKIEASPEFFLLTWWKSLASNLRSDQWTIYFLIALWLSILCFLAFAFMNVSARKLLFIGGLTGIILSVVLLLMAVTQHRYETGNDAAIITAVSASVKSAPLNSGTDLFIIHEGLKVQIINEENDWFKICLPDNKQGWLPKEMMAEI